VSKRISLNCYKNYENVFVLFGIQQLLDKTYNPLSNVSSSKFRILHNREIDNA